MIKATQLLIVGGLLISAAGCGTKEPAPVTTTASPNAPQAQAQTQAQAQSQAQSQGFTPRGSGPPPSYPKTR